jgi:hypothetical protein
MIKIQPLGIFNSNIFELQKIKFCFKGQILICFRTNLSANKFSESGRIWSLGYQLSIAALMHSKYDGIL